MSVRLYLSFHLLIIFDGINTFPGDHWLSCDRSGVRDCSCESLLRHQVWLSIWRVKWCRVTWNSIEPLGLSTFWWCNLCGLETKFEFKTWTCDCFTRNIIWHSTLWVAKLCRFLNLYFQFTRNHWHLSWFPWVCKLWRFTNRDTQIAAEKSSPTNISFINDRELSLASRKDRVPSSERHGLNFCRKTQLEFELGFISASLREFNWNLWKFPILFHLDFIVGGLRVVSKNQFRWFEIRHHSEFQRCEGISPSFTFSPESKCKFHRSVVPPSGARCVSSASLLVRTARRRKFPLKRRIIFDVKGIHTSSGRLRKVVLLMLLPYRLSPRERVSLSLAENWEIVESVHGMSAIISKGRERVLSRAARESDVENHFPPLQHPPASRRWIV